MGCSVRAWMMARAYRPARVSLAVRREDGRGCHSPGLVHPHVQRRILGVGETAVRDIQLQRRDTEIEQDAVHARESGAFDRPGDAVVDGVHRDQAVTEPGETLGGDAQGVGVAVEPDHRQRGKPLQQRLGVPAHSERRVHHDGVLAAERGSQQLDAALEEDGGMDVAQVHDVGPDHWALIPTR